MHSVLLVGIASLLSDIHACKSRLQVAAVFAAVVAPSYTKMTAYVRETMQQIEM